MTGTTGITEIVGRLEDRVKTLEKEVPEANSYYKGIILGMESRFRTLEYQISYLEDQVERLVDDSHEHDEEE